jgi:hypothetical protein
MKSGTEYRKSEVVWAGVMIWEYATEIATKEKRLLSGPAAGWEITGTLWRFIDMAYVICVLVQRHAQLRLLVNAAGLRRRPRVADPLFEPFGRTETKQPNATVN